MSLFSDLNLSRPVLRSLEDMGFESATPIQSEAIPVALAGRDLIGQAQTGTGKTVAFSIPMVELIDPTGSEGIQGLILTPTRELCIQVAEEIGKVGHQKRVSAVAIYGGQDINRQIRALRNRPNVIVATPGRLMDHMNRKTAVLANVKMVVLDEADEMLDMGFVDDIETILSACPTERQTLLFSATMKPGVRNLAKKFMKDFEVIAVKAQEVTVSSTQQEYYEVPERQKLNVLTRLLDVQNPELAIVFGRTKRRVDELTAALQTRGFLADGLHGDLSQRQRDAVMRKFRDGGIEILVATDVAARGLDVTGVSHVYNFDIPQDIDSYVHRIGRTGRAGQSGIAVTFVTPREIEFLHQIERHTKRKIDKQPLPSLAEAREGKQRVAMETISAAIDKDEWSNYRHMAEELLEGYDTIAIVSVALKLLAKETEEVPVTLTEEKSAVRTRRPQGGNWGDGQRSGERRKPSGGGYRGGSSSSSSSRGRSSSRDYSGRGSSGSSGSNGSNGSRFDSSSRG